MSRKYKEKATSKKSLFRPLPEGHPVDRDNFICLRRKGAQERPPI